MARTLPAWFTARGLEQLEVDLGFQATWVAEVDGTLSGFGCVYVAEAIGHLGWLGVSQARRRMGIGRHLVGRLAQDLANARVRELQVDTLGDSIDYPPYAETRAFYRGIGFEDIACVRQDDPEWPERLTLRLTLRRNLAELARASGLRDP